MASPAATNSEEQMSQTVPLRGAFARLAARITGVAAADAQLFVTATGTASVTFLVWAGECDPAREGAHPPDRTPECADTDAAPTAHLSRPHPTPAHWPLPARANEKHHLPAQSPCDPAWLRAVLPRRIPLAPAPHPAPDPHPATCTRKAAPAPDAA